MRVDQVGSFGRLVAGKAGFKQGRIGRFAICVEVPEPPTARRRVLFRVLDLELYARGGAGNEGLFVAKDLVVLLRRDMTVVQAMIAPWGKGSFPSRYALMATSLPKTMAKLWRLPSSWATEITFQSRYPAGIWVT
jgi:hypothetical protein